MFETAELGQVVDDETWEGHVDQVREGLLEVQQALRAADFPVIVVFAGIEKAGVGDTLNRLNTWMDPRGIRTLGYAMRDVEGRDLPPFWRYWSVLPTRGRMGMYDGAWYHQPLCSAIDQQINEATFDRELAEINAFEKMLADDGALILKFWLHLGAKQQADRLEALASDPDQSWRVQPSDWIELERHGQVAAQAEHMIARTSTPEAPWHIVEGTDPRFRDLRVSMLLLAAMQRRLDRPEAPSPAHDHWAGAPVLPRSILSTVDLKRSLKKSESRDLLPRAQGRLARLQREAQARGIPTVVVFEGWDAAGKGGSIRQVTQALDARQVAAWPVAAPTEDEKANHYMWRFWRRLPPPGCVTIFDRSWYGRVLVERVEGFASPEAWSRAYAEINVFERALVRHGTVLAKFWLHISSEEQEKRFRQRAEVPHKRWKLTDEDWRNREKWPDYEAAVHDMVERTSTRVAPWSLVPAESKEYARVEVLRILADHLEAALEGGLEVDPERDDSLG